MRLSDKHKKSILGSMLVFAILMGVVMFSIPAADSSATGSSNDFIIKGSTLLGYRGTDVVVTIPASVEVIDTEAFADQSSIQKVIVSEGVLEVKYSAFSNMDALKEVILPNTLTTIGKDAFIDCNALERITIGSGTKSIGTCAFSDCEKLKMLEISEDNPYFVVTDGVLYNLDKSKVVAMLPGREGSTYTMPASVTSTSSFAFYGNQNLEKVYLSGGIREIAPYAFANCKNINTVSIPRSVQTIGMHAFASCERLTKVTIPTSVSSVHPTAFADSGIENESHDEENKGEDTTKPSVTPNQNDTDSKDDTSDSKEDTTDVKDPDLMGETIIVNNEAVFFTDYHNADVISD